MRIIPNVLLPSYCLLLLRLAITGMAQMAAAAIYGIASIPVCTRSFITSSAVGCVYELWNEAVPSFSPPYDASTRSVPSPL